MTASEPSHLTLARIHCPFGSPNSSGRGEIADGGRLMLLRVDVDAAFAGPPMAERRRAWSGRGSTIRFPCL